MKAYKYRMSTVADENQVRASVFVPNCSTYETLEILRFLQKKTKEFPCYKDGDVLIRGIDDDAWCSPKEYREAYCPPTMACIVRER